MVNLAFYFTIISLSSFVSCDRRMHHGHNATAKYDPFFAPLLYRPWLGITDTEYRCGGIWIHKRYVLTTAYCLSFHKDINRLGYLILGNYWPWSGGEAYLTGIDEKIGHEGWDGIGDGRYENDIGLVKSSEDHDPVGFFLKPFSDWKYHKHSMAAILYASGRTETGSYSRILQYMKGRLHFNNDSYVIKNCDCGPVRKRISMCFKPSEDGARIDNGDYGSPLYYNTQDPDTKFSFENVSIVGLVSDRFNFEDNIIVTNVSAFTDWILEKMHFENGRK